MIEQSLSPGEWRNKRGLSLEAAAAIAGIGGKNPSRTWQRWELGIRQPPVDVIALLEVQSDGALTAASWAKVRAASQDRRRKRVEHLAAA